MIRSTSNDSNIAVRWDVTEKEEADVENFTNSLIGAQILPVEISRDYSETQTLELPAVASDGTATTSLRIPSSPLCTKTYFLLWTVALASMIGSVTMIYISELGGLSQAWQSLVSSEGKGPLCITDRPTLEKAVDAWLLESPLPEYEADISQWCVQNVQDLSHLFSFQRNVAAYKFNAELLSRWNVSETTNMAYMLYGAEQLVGNTALSLWDTSRVTDMSYMFYEARTFQGNISSWDTSRVTSMEGMFEGATAFNGDLSSWNVSSVTTMHRMLAQTSAFDQDLSQWNVRHVQDMSYMFDGAVSFTGTNLDHWDVSGATDMSNLFTKARKFDHNLCSWRTRLSDNPWVYDMFVGSSCPYQEDPLGGEGPFCYQC